MHVHVNVLSLMLRGLWTGWWRRLFQHAPEIQGPMALHVARRLEEDGEMGVSRKLKNLQGGAHSHGTSGEKYAGTSPDRALDVGFGSIVDIHGIRTKRC